MIWKNQKKDYSDSEMHEVPERFELTIRAFKKTYICKGNKS